MKKLLLIPAMLMAFSAFAQEAGDGLTPQTAIGTTTSPWILKVQRTQPNAEIKYHYIPEYDQEKYLLTYTIENVDQTDNNNPKTSCYYFTAEYYEEGSSSAKTSIALGYRYDLPLYGESDILTVHTQGNNKAVFSTKEYALCDSKWTAFGYFPTVKDGEGYSIAFYNPTETKFTQRAVGSPKEEIYINGANPADYFDTTQSDIANPGINKATIDYKTGSIIIEKVAQLDISISDITTLVLPYNSVIPEGITAYIIDEYSGNSIILKKLENNIIPAYTPVILKASESKNYSFSIPEDWTFDHSAYLYYLTDGQSKFLKDVEVKVGDDIKFYGVNQFHYLPANSYYLASKEFVLNKDTKCVINPFTCYIQLPENEMAESIEIVFPAEEEEPIEPEPDPEDMFYVHFTDADGNYTSTFVNGYFGPGPNSCLTKKEDGSYSLGWIAFTSDPTYYVLSKYPYPTSVVEEGEDENENEENEISLVVYDPSSWANFNGTIYHNGGEIDPTEENVIPFSQEAGNYQITFDPNNESSESPAPVLKESVLTGVGEVEINKAENEMMYNIFGMPVDENYKGIVIKNGKKMILR